MHIQDKMRQLQKNIDQKVGIVADLNPDLTNEEFIKM